MIRGAIEVAKRSRVVGWIHSDTQPLKGKTVLAFVGDRCVGSGEVDGFRQDLLDAKLGDGFCGFDFPVWLAEGESIGGLIVRLQFSDVALLQQTSRIVGDETGLTGPDFGAIQPHSVSWMMDRGMLEQPEYDFLKALHSVGAYERGLRTTRRGAGEPSTQRIDPETAARDLLAVMMMSEMRVDRLSLPTVSDIAHIPHSAAPVLALWSQERSRISLDERSHLTGPRGESPVLSAPPPGGIDYSFGPDRLLFVHRDCRFAARGPAPASGIVVFTASPTEVVQAEQMARNMRAA
jgi:hypothetical protein